MILFAGDSFSHFSDEGTWTDTFAKKVNSSFKNISSGGTSLWSTYQQLLQNNLDILNTRYDYIVITCTSPQRIPYCVDSHLSYHVGNPAPISDTLDNFSKDILHFGYFERFYDRNMHMYLYEKNIRDMAYQYPQYSKLVLLPCFKESYEIIKKVYNDHKNFLYLDFPLMRIMSNLTNDKNHFNLETNIKFGNLLAEKIILQDFGAIDIDLNDVKLWS